MSPKMEINFEITHVIFDMDGLLLDTEPLYEKAMLNVAKKYGRDYPFELKKQMMGRTGSEGGRIFIEFLSLSITLEEFEQEIEEQYRQIFSDSVSLMPGAKKLVQHLHTHKIPIAVATSSKGFTFKLKTKSHKDLFSLFDHILIAPEDPEVKRGKPDPQTFLVCASRFPNPPKDMSKVLVFEDSTAGVQAANAAGMRSVWVPESRMPKDAVIPTLILGSLEEFEPEKFGLPSYK